MNDTLHLCANTIRGLAMDAVQKANSGHPGMPMGMAEVATVLWTRFLRYSIEDPRWPGRDRFVLSAGHGSMLLYAALHLAGFNVGLEDIKQFRQLRSKTPGHPEYGDTDGVETTTGPLGQGFANGVGMALGARMEAARYRNPHYLTRVFGIVSDGDLMEGISSEAASLAGHLGLANLVYLYDDNHITIAGKTNLSFSEDVRLRFEGFGWRVLGADGHDIDAVAHALEAAVEESDKPTLITCRTHIAKGSPNKQDTADSHGAPLGEDEVALAKKALGLPAEEFFVPDEVREIFGARTKENEAWRREWIRRVAEVEATDPALAAEHRAFRERHLPRNLLDQLVEAAGNDGAATRALSGRVIQRAAELVPSLVSGCADLEPSTKTVIKASTPVSRTDMTGRNLHFGIREHGMAGVLNGMALQGGYLPIGSTFLVFSDYMRPSIRLAALMQQRVGFIFTHDSVMVGEDGPTHQPVEHVSALRLIPNLHVWRPADGPEVAAAWTAVLSRPDGPVALSLTRQGLSALDRPDDFDIADLMCGGYVVWEPEQPAKAVVIATGSEVSNAVAAARQLAAQDHHLRVVSMPCAEVFLSQPESYRAQVLPRNLPVLAVELGCPEYWCQFTGRLDRVLGQSEFGKSAPAKVLAEEFGWTVEKIAERLLRSMAGTGI
ncbi:MAG: transketolase [Planctomycetota bacterium]|jgi:transketolase